MGLTLVPDAVAPDAEQGCACSRNIVSNFCPGRSLNLGPCILMIAKVTPRLRRTVRIDYNYVFEYIARIRSPM